jgi:hypothetical protein
MAVTAATTKLVATMTKATAMTVMTTMVATVMTVMTLPEQNLGEGWGSYDFATGEIRVGGCRAGGSEQGPRLSERAVSNH